MSEKKILIFGVASGIGKIILSTFSENKDFTLFAQTTNKDKFEKLNKKYEKVTFLHDTLENKEHTLSYAKGIENVFIILSEVEEKSLVSENLINVLNENEDIKHVILLSVHNLESNKLGTSKEYSKIEKHFKESEKFKLTILRTVFFQENLLDWRKSIQGGKLRLPIGEGKIPLLSSRDVAIASAKIFSEGESHYGKTYELIGPDFLDGKQMASILSSGLEREIVFESCDTKTTHEDLKNAGLVEWKIDSRIELLESISEGIHNDIKTESHELVESPVKFEDFVKNNAGKFKKGSESLLKISPKNSPRSSPRKSPKNQPSLSPREKQPGSLSFRILQAKGLKKGNYFVQVTLGNSKRKFKTENQTEKKATDPVWNSETFSTGIDNSRDEVVFITLYSKGIFNTAKGELSINVSDLKVGIPYRKWCKLTHKEKLIGEILIDIMFANFNDKLIGSEFDWPIHSLLKKKNAEGVKLLLSEGEERVGTDNHGFTALMVAAQNDVPEAMEILLEKTKYNLESKSNEGQTALHYASQYSGECVKLLLEKNANFKQEDSKGLLPLHIAAKFNNGNGTLYLLKKGADVNEQCGDNQDTPLHFAIFNNSYSVLKPLADFKVNPFILNKDKKTPISYLFKEKAKDPMSESGSTIHLYDGAPSKIDEQTRIAVLEAFDIIDPRELLCKKTHPERVQFSAKPINSHFTLKSSQFCVYSKGKSSECKVIAHLNGVVGLQNEKIGAAISKWSDKPAPIYKQPTEVRNVVGFTSEEPLRITFEADTYYIVHLFTKYKEDLNETANFIIYTLEENKDNIHCYELKDWPHHAVVKSEWKGETARGPQPNEDWDKNPNFKLTVPKEKDVKLTILLSQNRVNTDSDFIVQPYSVFVGFYVYHPNMEDKFTQLDKWLNTRDVFLTFDWDGSQNSELIVVPTTHKEGTEKSFSLSVFSNYEVSLELKN